jgi:hypothetical protein
VADARDTIRTAGVVVAVLAAAAVLIWLVAVPVPRARRAARQVEALRDSVAALQESLASLRAWSGAVQPLVLVQPQVGAPPRLLLRPEQPSLPIVVAHDIMGDQQQPGSRWMQLRIVRLPDEREVWRHPERLSQLWDPAVRFVSLLVPSAPLRAPGTYRLEIHEPGASQPRFAARFEVVDAAALPP